MNRRQTRTRKQSLTVKVKPAAPKNSPDSMLGQRRSMHDVAVLAEVSVSSVSRVLSGHPDTSAATRERVLAAARALDFEPDFLAQSLRRGASMSVGFVLGDISNPLMAGIASGAEGVLRQAGYSMLVMNSENDPLVESQHLRFFAARRVDGMLLSLASETNEATLFALRQLSKVPMVLIDRDLPASFRIGAVVSDHGVGMKGAVNHLLNLGHRRIALVAGRLEVRPGHARVEALKQAIASYGIRDETVVVGGSFTPEHGRSAVLDLMQSPSPPTALIVGGNQLLEGCIKALRELGLSIGTDISVITCDDVPLAQLNNPPIAVISRDVRGLGREAARLLLQGIRDEAEPEIMVLPTSFEIRASCGPVRSSSRKR